MRFLKASLVVITSLGIGGYSVLRSPSDHGKRIARVERLAEQGVARGYWPGFMWAEVAPGHIVSVGAAGFADVEGQEPMMATTTMPIGSITKVIVGLSAAQAIHDGLLDVTVPLSTFLTIPLDAPDGLPRTFENLATHTSGILDAEVTYEGNGYHFGAAKHPVTLSDFLISYLSKDGPLYDADANFGSWAPGTRYAYSNIAAGLAGQAISDATKRSFANYSMSTVAEPLGLSGFWGHTIENPVDAATLYSRSDVGDFRALEPYGIATWPDGQFNASVVDLATLLATVMNDGVFEGRTIFDPAVISLLTEPRVSNIEGLTSAGDKIGLFWNEETLSFGPISLTMLGHNGGDPGVLTLMYQLPNSENGFVVMLNGLPDSTLGEVQLVRIIRLLAEMPNHGG